MGLFDIWGGGPSSEAELAVISGLLGGRGNFGGILGRAIASGQGQYGQSAAFEQQKKTQDAQTAYHQGQLDIDRQRLDMMKLPKPGEGFTLSPGQMRFGPDGRPVASAPAAPVEEKDAFLRIMKSAGIDPDSVQGRALLQNYLTKQSTHQPPIVQMGLGSPVAVTTPDGKQVLVQPPTKPGGQAEIVQIPGMGPVRPATADKPLTDSQSAANLYASRMEKADKIINDLEGQYNRGGLALRQRAGDGALGTAGNAMISPKAQQVDQAQRDFINAVLRRESGAVISPSEFENARQQYFPQPGDSTAVVSQKSANRRTAIEGIKAAAGSRAPVANEPVQPSRPGGSLDDLLKKYGN